MPLGIMRTLYLAAAVLALSGCASGPSLGKVTDVVIVEAGLGESDGPDDNCESFKPSPRQVRAFLNRGVIVGSIHDFRWSPCYAKGTATVGGSHAAWTMSLHGLGSVEVSSHGILHNVASREAIRSAEIE